MKNLACLVSCALLTIAAASPARSQTAATDEWVCEFCPFETGSRADFEVGALSASESSAYFGDATGIDEDGVYASIDGSGTVVGEQHRLRWSIADLGLDSRSLALDGGQPGLYEYSLAYREIPRRQFNTTQTIFRQNGNGTSSLPSTWQRGASIADFTTLASSLAPRNIESDREILKAGGRYFPTEYLTVSLDYRQQEHSGTKMKGASFFTTASILPMPFDYSTDEVDVSLRFATASGFVTLGWYLSDFENANTAISWENPFVSPSGLNPASVEAFSLSSAPDNQFQQLSARGAYWFPMYDTVISASAALGEIEQNDVFLPYTQNSNIASGALPRNSLNGEIDTRNLAFGLMSKPLQKLKLKLNYRFDERDNRTAQDLWNRVLVDSFSSGDIESNLPYSYQRSALRLRGDYDLFDILRVSAGYDRNEIDRDFQEVAEQTENSGWGQLRWRPLPSIEVDVRGGASKRDIDRYNDTLSVSLGQNPLLRKYNLAYRYREFGEVSLSYSMAELPISATLSALFADDSYSRSTVGLRRGKELMIDADLSWSISDNSSFYLNVGIEDIEADQSGSDQFAAADWFAQNDDSFVTVAGGFRVSNIAEKVDIQLDYLNSTGTSEITIDSATGTADRFPDLKTDLDYLRGRLTYRWSEKMDINLNLAYQQFESTDWTLAGVEPDTIPGVLGLGPVPYDDDLFVIGIGVLYRLGTATGN